MLRYIPGQPASSESSEQSIIPSHFQLEGKHWSVVAHLNSSALQPPVGPPVGGTVGPPVGRAVELGWSTKYINNSWL